MNVLSSNAIRLARLPSPLLKRDHPNYPPPFPVGVRLAPASENLAWNNPPIYGTVSGEETNTYSFTTENPFVIVYATSTLFAITIQVCDVDGAAQPFINFDYYAQAEVEYYQAAGWLYFLPALGTYTVSVTAIEDIAVVAPVPYYLAVGDPIAYARFGNGEVLQSPTMAALASAEALAPGSAEQYMNYRQANQMGPLIEPDPTSDEKKLVTFLFLGDETTRSVILNGGPNPEVDGIPLIPFCDTFLWYITLPSLTSGKFGYYFNRASAKSLSTDATIYQDNWVAYDYVLDPLNSDITVGVESQLILADGGPAMPPEALPSPYARGSVTRYPFPDENDPTFYYNVYQPVGFVAENSYPLLIGFDAEEMVGSNATIPMANILDNLIGARTIQSTVAVLIETSWRQDRTEILTCNDAFIEVVVAILREFWITYPNVGAIPLDVYTTGFSLGGLTAMYCNVSRPDVFGNVISMSGSFWVDQQALYPSADTTYLQEGVIQQAVRNWPQAGNNPPRFYLGWGGYEVREIALTNMHLFDLLHAKGYEPGTSLHFTNHNELGWNFMLVDGLTFLLST